jgi:Tfp pilus assembly protein PilF
VRIATVPTLLVADPWGNEVIRMVGPTPLQQAVRVLNAIPGDFRPLRAAGEALRQDPARLDALLAAAAFYEGAGLGVVAERYYERASLVSAAKDDTAVRRPLVIARGLNLLRLGKPKDAARLFEDEAGRGLEGPQADVVLFGWAMASLTGGDTAKARKLGDDLSRRFPDSAYAKRLRENLSRAGSLPPKSP